MSIRDRVTMRALGIRAPQSRVVTRVVSGGGGGGSGSLAKAQRDLAWFKRALAKKSFWFGKLKWKLDNARVDVPPEPSEEEFQKWFDSWNNK